jgi:Flp pilus assembly protein TadB
MIDETKYERELESEINPKQESHDYSLEYRQFLKEQMSSNRHLYSKACRFSEKIIPAHVSNEDATKINSYLQLLHIAVSPQSTRSLAFLSAIVTIIISVFFTVILANIYVLVFGLVGALSLLYVFYKAPDIMFKMWRSQASDQLVSAVLYMVIYLEHTSNLEQAVYFAAKNLPPPLSLDFIKILWQVESGKYSNISTALEEYSKVWKDWNPGFVEAIHLLESSLYVSTDEHRHEVLERTINTVLQSTEHTMMKYARETQNPVQAVHMLGIILPVMGLVMLPMVVSFMGDVVSIWHVILLYNVTLPLIVYLLSKHTIDNRPSGVNTSDIYDFYADKNYKAKVKLGKKLYYVSPKLAGLTVALLFILPSVLYFTNLYSKDLPATATNGLIPLFFSLLTIIGLGFGIGTYYKLRIKDLIKQQDYLNKLDEEFSNSIFQLGNRLEEGIPVENAFKKVADTMPKSPVAGLFNKIYNNLITSRMNLKEAVFDEKVGAVAMINSSLIRGVMRIIVEGSQKGSKIVAFSLITISRFLNSIKNVNERLKDLLAETIASLESEVKVFIPLIIGIVVSMAVLTTNILINLSVQMQQLTNVGGDGEQLSFGTTLLDIFNIDYLIPAWAFQLVVGIYLIQVTILMSYLLSGIIHGPQKVERGNTIQKNLFISTVIYFIVTLSMSALFIVITKGIGVTV